MKHLKISFLAIIAILALGLSAATKANIFESSTAPVPCVQNIDYASVIDPSNVIYANQSILPTGCVFDVEDCVTQPVLPVCVASTTINCDSEEDLFFCCLKRDSGVILCKDELE